MFLLKRLLTDGGTSDTFFFIFSKARIMENYHEFSNF